MVQLVAGSAAPARSLSKPMNEPRANDSSSDASLLVRLQAGEDDAATALYTRYAQRLLELADRNAGEDLAQRIDAEDIVQSVFRTFFRRVSDGHYLVPEGEELWKLLLVIALNKVRSIAEHHRAAKRDVSQTHSISNQESLKAPGASQVLTMTIEDVLSTVPEINRQIVRLRIDGHTVEEIAKRSGMSRRSIERVLQAFRKRLQSTLEGA